MSPLRLFRPLALAVFLGGFAMASVWSVRVAVADYWFRQETPEATEKAIALTPTQAAYHVRLALLVGDDDPARALAALHQAIALNPSDSRAFIELGLRNEALGNLPEAEENLLRAAAIDKTYVPRWSLMNYYFRRSNTAEFWSWAKQAVPMIYGDALPLFHLCGNVEEDGNLIDRLDIRKTELQAGYLFYLLDAGHANLAGRASRRLLEGNRPADVPLLLDSCDRLIDAGRLDEALLIWNGLLSAGRLPFPSPVATSQPQLTNGDFSVSATGHGFDWRLPTVEGVSAAREESPSGLRLTFSGSQPEQTEALLQFVPVRENTPYRVSFTYQTHQIEAATGLHFRVTDSSNNRVLVEGPDLASEAQSDRQIDFDTPSGCRLARLSLVYRRRPGTIRINGYVVLRKVSIKGE